MKPHSVKEKNRLREAWSLLLADVHRYRVGLSVGIAYWLLANLLFHAYCPLRLLTGIPCPACGLTHAGTALLLLHPGEAWHWHPMIYLIAPLILAWAICRYFLYRPLPYGRIWLILTLLLMIAIYPYRLLADFPNEYGLYYYERNLTAHLHPGYTPLLQHVFGAERPWP